VAEVVLIPDGDLEALKSFDSEGSLALSVYLPLDTPQSRESAHDEFVRQVEIQLAECQAQPDCRKAVREDIEIVSLYLKTNGHRRHTGLAIFSCAPSSFGAPIRCRWRSRSRSGRGRRLTSSRW